MKRHLFCLAGTLLLLTTSCKKTEPLLPTSSNTVAKAQGILPPVFNWETVDWMPTPPGQSQIPPPWIGQGGIASTYGPEVVNDHKASDGWILLYNTFDPNAPGPLQNPYFILYNRYKGLMRIYLYTTTPFISPSTYIIDGLSVVSTTGSSMLNYLGTEISDPAARQTSFSQIEQAPLDGSQPLGTNKWYMLQYEIAYDPNIQNLSSNNIQLSWFTNYNSIAQISLGGTLTGTIKSPVGAPGDALGAVLKTGGEIAGKSALALGAKAILDNNGNATTGVNTLGLSNNTFKSIAKAVTGALSSATGGIPGLMSGLFSAIIGQNSAGPSTNLNIDAKINLTGTLTTTGSFPASPTSFYVPGSNTLPTAQNYIPLSNIALGVFNLKARPVIDITFNAQNFLLDPLKQAQICIDYHSNSIENDLFTINPAAMENATMQTYSEEPVFVFDHEYPPVPDISISGQYEQKGDETAVVTTDDLDGSYSGFCIISSTMVEDLQHAIFGYAPPYLSHLAVRVKFRLACAGGYVAHIKTFRANVKLTETEPNGTTLTRLVIPD